MNHDVSGNWSVWCHDLAGEARNLGRVEVSNDGERTLSDDAGEVRIQVRRGEGDVVAVEISLCADGAGWSGWLSLQGEGGQPWSFNGLAAGYSVLRQSPHDPGLYDFRGLSLQAVPMVALRIGDGWAVAVSDAPAFYDNATTQTFDPEHGRALLSSGDGGDAAGMVPVRAVIQRRGHRLAAGERHLFRAILLGSAATDLTGLRRDVLSAVARRWRGGTAGRFGDTAFASNYLHLRKNETGHSRLWICPGIDYANKQYSRDAFWQSWVLAPEHAAECYRHEAGLRSTGAERPLFLMIWAWRLALSGGTPDAAASRWALDYLRNHCRDGWYFSEHETGKRDFQSWYDLCAFAADDVITYNQGLLAVALAAAEKLGLDMAGLDAGLAAQRYREMFDEEAGGFPLSRQKRVLCVDALVGDLLAWLLLGRPLLDAGQVHRHFARLQRLARTAYGYKVTCAMADGAYLPPAAYSVADFRSNIENASPGEYQYGGSWYLYDMLCLLDGVAHQAPAADAAARWRASLDFQRTGTYCEFLNTRDGAPGKPNQGWNGAIWAIWRQMIATGLAPAPELAL